MPLQSTGFWWGPDGPDDERVKIAYCVQKNSPPIPRLLKAAENILGAKPGDPQFIPGASDGDPCFDAYGSGRRGRVHTQVYAIFAQLQRCEDVLGHRLTYRREPDRRDGPFGLQQRIRLTKEVLQDGIGTCIDLTCMKAGALLNVGIHPLIVICRTIVRDPRTGQRQPEKEETHAILGYWLEERQFSTPVVDWPTLRANLKDKTGQLIAFVNATRVAPVEAELQRQKNYPDGLMPFEEAQDEAVTEWLPLGASAGAVEVVCAIDVQAAIDELRRKALETYLAYIRRECSEIELAGIEGVDGGVLRNRPTMDNVYVPLHLRREPVEAPSIITKGSRGAGPRFIISQVLSKHRLVVVLGKPGSGKSTLIKFIALACADGRAVECGLAKLHDATGQSTDNLIPLLISFRDHPLPEAPVPLLHEFIARILQKACEHLMLIAKPIVQTELFELFKSALSQGRCVLLLDGLDEVSNVKGAREMIAKRITEWTHKYPNCRFIVTSRIAGYQEVRANIGPEFEHFILCDFEPEDMDQFIENWCHTVETSPDFAAQQAKSLRESIHRNLSVEQLARNPLLLTMLTLVHRRGRGLSNRQVKLYEKAVKLLLKNWGRSPGIPEREPISVDQSLPQLQFVARKMMEAGQLQIEREELEFHLTKALDEIPHLKNMTIVGPDELIDRVKERSGLLVKVDVDRYQFCHQSFQEYLAARAIAKDPDPFLSIERFLERRGWWEVIRLCAASLDEQRATSFVKHLFLKHLAAIPQELRHLTPGYRYRCDLDHSLLYLAALCLADDAPVTEAVADEILDHLAEMVAPDAAAAAVGSELEVIRSWTLRIYAELRGSRYEQRAADHLIKWMEARPETERPPYAAALLQLGWSAPPKIVVEACCDLREGEQWQIRTAAANTLRWLDEKAITAEVLTSLASAVKEDREARVRAEAARAIADLWEDISWLSTMIPGGTEELLSNICSALSHETNQDAIFFELGAAFRVSGGEGFRQALDVLQRRLMSEPSAAIRWTIISGLQPSNINYSETEYAQILELLHCVERQDPDEGVRSKARDVLYWHQREKEKNRKS